MNAKATAESSVTSHLTRGAWIEMIEKLSGFPTFASHLTRGAWIEIYLHIPQIHFL